MADPERIWLAPECNSDYDEERCWTDHVQGFAMCCCYDNGNDARKDDPHPHVEYVRVDLHEQYCKLCGVVVDERCPNCNTELSACGEMTSDGPRMDCRVCLLKARVAELEAVICDIGLGLVPTPKGTN